MKRAAPLTGLSPTAGRPWVGYYTFVYTRDRHPPMFFEPQSSDLTPKNAESDYVYFYGEGQGWVGAVSPSRERVTPGWSGVITP